MKKEAIVLKYSSTRGNAEQLDSAKAIIRGLAADGGLFVPDAMPQVDMAFIEGLKALSYEERAEKVLGLFLTDYTAEELAGCVTRAYANGRFDERLQGHGAAAPAAAHEHGAQEDGREG